MRSFAYYFLLTGLLLTFSDCDPISQPNGDLYEVTVISKFINRYEDNINVKLDTIKSLISLQEGDVFQERMEGVESACQGRFRIDKEYFTFASEECGCWCQCLPNVDCGGHPILGQYSIQPSDKSGQWNLFYTFTSTYSTYFSDSYTVEKYVRLSPVN